MQLIIPPRKLKFSISGICLKKKKKGCFITNQITVVLPVAGEIRCFTCSALTCFKMNWKANVAVYEPHTTAMVSDLSHVPLQPTMRIHI